MLDRYATMESLDLDETKSTRPTPSDSTNEIMDAISRRVDGKLVVRTCRATRKGKSSSEFDCPLHDTDQAGEAQTRLPGAVRAPRIAPADTAAGRRPGSRRGRRPGDDRPAGRIHRGPRTVRSRALTARTKREDAPSATRNRHAPGGLGAEQDLWSVTSLSSGIEHHAGQQRGRTEQDELLRTRPHEVARTELNADRERGGTQADGRRQPAHTAQRRPCR